MTKKAIVVQTTPGPISLSPLLLSCCRGNTQLIQDLFTEDNAPLIYTCCRTNAPPKKGSFEDDMSHKKKQRDEDTIRSISVEEDSKDEEV